MVGKQPQKQYEEQDEQQQRQRPLFSAAAVAVVCCKVFIGYYWLLCFSMFFLAVAAAILLYESVQGRHRAVEAHSREQHVVIGGRRVTKTTTRNNVMKKIIVLANVGHKQICRMHSESAKASWPEPITKTVAATTAAVVFRSNCVGPLARSLAASKRAVAVQQCRPTRHVKSRLFQTSFRVQCRGNTGHNATSPRTMSAQEAQCAAKHMVSAERRPRPPSCSGN